MDKKTLRKEILKKRDALSSEERRIKSGLIAKEVFLRPAFEDAKVILLFSSFRSEVDTTEIFYEAIRAKKRVYYPRVIGKEMEFFQVESVSDFETGSWGILEPKMEESKKFVPTSKDKVCMIMPGAVFDIEGNRIGYGGGYYDKYLQKIECEMYKMAIAFACQIVYEGMIQAEAHDRRADCLITEDGVFFLRT